MTLRPLVRLLLSFPVAVGRPVRAGRRRGRTAVFVGGLAFGLLTLGLVLAAETIKPEWRDPEYGYRLKQLRHWQRMRPDRPLVLVVGSSLAQQGVSPAAMDLLDEPGQPLVYNLGYRGATPVGVCLQFERALDDGVRPRAVLVMLSGVEIRVPQPPEEELWVPRFSRADLRRLEPYAEDPAALRRKSGAARRRPWVTYAPALIGDVAPVWQLSADHFHHAAWTRMDGYGFSPYPVEYIRPAQREQGAAAMRVQHEQLLNALPPGEVSVRALRALIKRCRAEGIAAAACWAPEAPAYRALYTPRGRAVNDAFERSLAADLGVPVFPAPTDLGEDDFADGYHLLPGAATRYSRWLAGNHLKPWLAQVLK